MELSPVLPYLYHPGRKNGTEEHPLPSKYPTMLQVVQACCDAFQNYGRACALYSHEITKDIPALTPEVVMQRSLKRLVCDVRAMSAYIIREHSRWIRSHRDPPMEYTSKAVAHYLGISYRSAIQYQAQMQHLIGTNECLTEIYFICLEELAKDHSVYFPRYSLRRNER